MDDTENHPTIRGRPSSYNQAIADEICTRMACGESLRSICREEKFPAHSTVIAWALRNEHGFSDQYARAREVQAEGFYDELLDIADDGSNDWMARANKKGEIEIVLDREHVTRSNLRLQARQWAMSKILAKKYGDKAKDEPNDQNKIIVEGGLSPPDVDPSNPPDVAHGPNIGLPDQGQIQSDPLRKTLGEDSSSFDDSV